jgi:hypothetical protein
MKKIFNWEKFNELNYRAYFNAGEKLKKLGSEEQGRNLVQYSKDVYSKNNSKWEENCKITLSNEAGFDIVFTDYLDFFGDHHDRGNLLLKNTQIIDAEVIVNSKIITKYDTTTNNINYDIYLDTEKERLKININRVGIDTNFKLTNRRDAIRFKKLLIELVKCSTQDKDDDIMEEKLMNMNIHILYDNNIINYIKKMKSKAFNL